MVLTTASPVAELTLNTGSIIDTAVVSDGGTVRVGWEGNHVSFDHDAGVPGEAQVLLLVSGIGSASRVQWRTMTSPASPTELEIYNENIPGRGRLVDRFETQTGEAVFESPADRLRDGGPLTIGDGPSPLVLAFFYPWYQHFNWTSDRLLDAPLFQYSTEMANEVARSLADAREAGLDGVIVSWRGDTDWNDRRLRIVLDEAQKLGLRVSILVETLWAAQPGHVLAGDLDAGIMRAWLEKASSTFTEHRAFLRTRGLPVIFVYAADRFSATDWRAITRALTDAGRHLFLMADSLDPNFLESFNGAFTYTTATVPEPSLRRFDADQALRTQSFNLLHGGRRRVAAATAIPGYDDSPLGRDTTLVVDRMNGALYEAQWHAAVSARPDWMLVTTWNEYYENTYIEPSTRYGRLYQRRTRAWSDVFHDPRARPTR